MLEGEQRAMARSAGSGRTLKQSYSMAAGTSLLVIGLLLLWYLAGMLGLGQFLLIAAMVLGWVVVFYLVFRTGANRKAKDPSLTLHQMVAASLTLLVGAYAADGGRALFLVLFVVVLMFGVLRISTRALLGYTALVLSAYAVVVGLLYFFKPQTLDLRLELLQLLVSAVTMPWFAVMGGYISALRERMKSALRTAEESERRLAEAQRLANFGSWSFDASTGVTEWSRETYRIFGVDPGERVLAGPAFQARVHKEDRQRYSQLLEEALLHGKMFDTEIRIVLPSDGVRWVHTVARPNVGDTGATVLRGSIMDITERKAAEAKIRQLAHFDPITGLPNRNLLMQLLRHALAKAQRHGTSLAVLFIDLDGFKNVNDTLGHDAGDALLQAFGLRLAEFLRESDAAARFGGDEFIVLLEGVGDEDGLEVVAKRVLASASTPYLLDGQEWLVSASIGIARFPDGGTDLDELIKNADSAMYLAKRAGKSNFRIWRPPVEARDDDEGSGKSRGI